jgi:tetratricopeptide (TPR) repeat protein
MAEVSQQMAEAVTRHRRGDLLGAESLYREVLRLDPAHGDALHLLGVAAHQRGDYHAAVEQINRAISQGGATAAWHSNLGAAYRGAGQTDRAIASFRKAIRLDPNHTDAHYNLGNVLADDGRTEEAEETFRHLLDIDRQHAEAHFALGNMMRSQRRYLEAITSYRAACELRPEFATAHFALGNALSANHKADSQETANQKNGGSPGKQSTSAKEAARNLLAEVATCYERTLQIEPRHAKACNNLGTVRQDQDRLEEAIACYRRALALAPESTEAYVNLGTAFTDQGNLDEAVACYRRALQINPEFADAHFNLGNAQRAQDQLKEAAASYARAVQLAPDHFEAQVNRAVVLKDQRQFDQAIACYDRLLAVNPDCAEAHFNRSLIWLQQGDFAQGWVEYEWRRRQGAPVRRASTLPEWDGSPLGDRSLLIVCEQGVGDEIMFASCLAEVADRVARCVVECDPRLAMLLARSFPGVEFIEITAGESKTDGERTGPPCDVQIPLGSLPRFLRPSFESFPRHDAILKPDLELLQSWRSRLVRLGEGLKIGISWRGGKEADVRRKRSTSLDQWRSLLTTPDVSFINLQYDKTTDEMSAFAEATGSRLYDWSEIDPLVDLNGFAALVAALDLVISVDNSTVHLAGALGTPCWVLLPFASDWRWFLDREDSPWYPSVHLFRQSQVCEWDKLFDRVLHTLHNEIAVHP